MAECRSCSAPITWAITDNGKRIPLDPDPTPDGNIRLDLTNAHVIGKTDTYHGPRCPNAQQHRRSRPKSPAGRGLEGR